MQDKNGKLEELLAADLFKFKLERYGIIQQYNLSFQIVPINS
jgi:hypothetical protein